MSTETQEPMEMGTKPLPEHEWLKKLVGTWKTEAEMQQGPDQPVMTSSGTETVKMLGELWATGEGSSGMPNGEGMEYRTGLGYDVSFKGYRGFWVGSPSSHLWKYEGELSADGRTMTLNCEGPDMEVDGKTANYRDVIEIVDDNHRTLTSYGQDKNGEWNQFMKVSYTRA